MKNTFYITTPIYYPSGKLHIGNAYTTVAADAMARYKRMRGFDVFFLTGTDEHGQKIQRKAEEVGTTPKAYVDEIVAGIKDLWQVLNINYDKFIRTTDDYHIKAVQDIFQKLYDQGDIYKSQYEGWYCTPCETFWTLSQLNEGNVCPDCGREVEKTKEESYFFKMSKYQDQLLEYIEAHPDFIQPQSRRNEMLSFIKSGLHDLAVSRTTFDWGIPVPFDPKHIVYVWLDALTNYINALSKEQMAKYWGEPTVHLVGKDIVRFHTVIWPTILMALDLPLPNQVFAHGWLMLDGGKMSKSKGNVVDPIVLSERYSVDAIRYFVLREMPFGADGNFSNESLINRINADLANDLGNLVSRTVAMIDKYFGGSVKATGVNEDVDNELKLIALGAAAETENMMDQMFFSNALAEGWKLISYCNKYIDLTLPWVLAKDEEKKPRLQQVLYNLAEAIKIASVLISPVMPETAEKIRNVLGFTAYSGWDADKAWNEQNQYRVTKSDALFPRLDLEKELSELGVWEG